MTYDTPANYTGIFGKLIEYPAVVSDYWFPRLFLLGLLIILIGSMIHFKLNRAFASSMFIVAVLTVIFWLGNAVKTIDLYIAIIGLGLGIVSLILKKN